MEQRQEARRQLPRVARRAMVVRGRVPLVPVQRAPRCPRVVVPPPASVVLAQVGSLPHQEAALRQAVALPPQPSRLPRLGLASR
jgi:hypothetical protein